MKIHTLTRLRSAHKHEDGAEGILYMHQWPTGFQELIFANEKLADQFLARLNQEEDKSCTTATTTPTSK